MKPFPTPDLVWRPGESRLHVYALPSRASNAALLDVVDRVHAIVDRRFRDTNVPVREKWLHATVRMVALDARAVNASRRSDLATLLAARLAGLGPITLSIAGLAAAEAGIVAYLAEDGSGGLWPTLGDRACEVIAEVCGREAASFAPGPPHVSLTYCSQPTDSAPISAELAELDFSDSTFSFDQLELVDVVQDAQAHTYTWRPVASIPLVRQPRNP